MPGAREGGVVGVDRRHRLLEHELHAVGDAGEQAERAPAVGAEPALHVGDDLALEPDDEHHEHAEDEEHDEDLGDDDHQVGEEGGAHGATVT